MTVAAVPGLPDFLVIGAGKAGTSSLHSWLAAHPAVDMSQPKETNWFSVNYAEGLPHYRACFPEASGRRRGEATPSYLHLPHVPARIAAVLPAAQLIAVLRDPVERAYSDWWMHVRRGAERRSFARAVDEELRAGAPRDPEAFWMDHLRSTVTRQVRNTMYVAAGDYTPALRRYLDHFPTSQLTVLSFRELSEQPAAVAGRLTPVLGLEPGSLGTPPRENTADHPTWGPVLARRLPRATSLLGRQVVRAAAHVPMRRPGIAAETRARLEEHYARTEVGLLDLVGGTAAYWLDGPAGVDPYPDAPRQEVSGPVDAALPR